MPFQPTPYTPRPVRTRPPLHHNGWTLKRYDIHIDNQPIDDSTYAPGLDLALAALPSPAQSRTRPGVGFVICHHGAGVHYIVLSWWDNENELFQRIFIRPFDADTWSDADGRGSFCVWDAQIIAFERDAYVRCVLTPAPDIDAYLEAAGA